MNDPSRDVEAFAALAAALADPSADRAALLAAHGLDEDGWEALDEAWQARFSDAESDADNDNDDETAGVPPLVALYAETFAAVQRTRAESDLSFERFLDAARAMRRGTDMTTVLKRLELSLSDYLGAQKKWTAAMLEDGEFLARFQRAMK